jgi:hypothetical protein
MADTKVYLSGGRIQGRSDDSVVGSDEEIILDDNPSSQFSWGTGIDDYAPTTPTPSNHNNYNGVFINTNSVLKGKTLKKIKAWLCKFGSPNTSGTIRLGVMSGTGSGSTITWVTDAYVDIENLISGESGGVTLNTGFPATAVPIEITLPTAHVLAENDNIALGLTGGNYGSGTNVGWQYSNGNAVYDGSDTSRNRFSNGGWTGSGMSSDMHTTITVEGTTAKDKTSITNAEAGTRYEEVDTRKIFRRTGLPYAADWIEKGKVGFLESLRGLFGGGEASGGKRDEIEYITIQSVGNATDFGDLTAIRYVLAGCADATRGCFAGGYGTAYSNVIDYVTVASAGNATDFGDLLQVMQKSAGLDSLVRGVYAGGSTGSDSNVIEWITIATASNAGDFGDLTAARFTASGLSSDTRGVISGGVINNSPASNIMDYITIATQASATDFGDLTLARTANTATANETRGVISGGYDASETNLNVIDYITIATTGNATDFGDIITARHAQAACADSARGVFSGGNTETDDIQYITISTLGNSTDFGNLVVGRKFMAGLAA